MNTDYGQCFEAPCGNDLEMEEYPYSYVCGGTLHFGAVDDQAKCDRCGAYCGRLVAFHHLKRGEVPEGVVEACIAEGEIEMRLLDPPPAAGGQMQLRFGAPKEALQEGLVSTGVKEQASQFFTAEVGTPQRLETEEVLTLEAEPSGYVRSSARFSECRRYRYDLWRRWGEGPYAMFVGLNPSTADETVDDPTIRRCIAFAKAWGYGALCMTNLFAFRATAPKDMKAAAEPVGEDNDGTLLHWAEAAGVVVAAWGVHGVHQGRDAAVLKLLPGIQCLGVSKEGHPRHPLYLKGDLKPVPFKQSV